MRRRARKRQEKREDSRPILKKLPKNKIDYVMKVESTSIFWQFALYLSKLAVLSRNCRHHNEKEKVSQRRKLLYQFVA